MHSRKPWRRADTAQPYRPWNLQLLKAAQERSSAVEPAKPEPAAPITPVTPTEPTDHERVDYKAVSQPETASPVRSDTISNASPFFVPTPVRTPEPAPEPPTPEATPIDELPPWVNSPELRPRRDTFESTQSCGSNWGAGPLVNDWSQFESQMKSVKEPSETEMSPSTSIDSTSQPLVGDLVDVDDDGVSTPVDPSTWPQLDMSPMPSHHTSPARLRRSQMIQDDEDDDLEWVTNDTYQPEQDMQDLRRYSREELFDLSTNATTDIGFDAANRIDQQMQMRRRSTLSDCKPGVRVIREVRQPPQDHSGGFSPGIPPPTRIRMLAVYDAL